MVMNIEPIDNCIKQLKAERNYNEIIYLSPDGENLKQEICNTLSTHKNIIFAMFFFSFLTFFQKN